MKDDNFKQICHFIAGVVLMPFAFKLFEQKQFVNCIILLAFGIFFVFVSAMHDWLDKKLGDVVKLVFLLEAIVLLFVSFINFERGKKIPTYAAALGGIIFFLLFVYFLYRKDSSKKHRKHRRHRHHSSSSSHRHSSHDANTEN